MLCPAVPEGFELSTSPFFKYYYLSGGEKTHFFFGQITQSTMRCLDAALTLDGTLNVVDRQRRKVFFLLNFIVLCATVVFGLNQLRDMRERYIYFVATAATFVTSLFSVLLVVRKRRLTTTIIVTTSGISCVCLLFYDLTGRAEYKYAWPIMVLVIDFLLVMGVPAHYTTAVVACTLVYLALITAEETIRFGILDLPGLVTQEDRRDYVNGMGDCTSLPCTQSTAVTHFAAAAVVFVIDFIATRGFARGLLKEQASMERTINVVQEIASLLAGYDVEQVAELLKAHEGDLPEGMTVALRRLEENLRMYKAYLPQTCLPFENEKERVLSLLEGSLSMADQSTESRTSRSVSMSSSNVLVRCSVRAQPLGLLSAKVTLLTVNVKDTLSRLVEDSACFSDLFTTLLLKTLQGTETRRGMVDVFIGDRIHCSFNASKQCASHAASALHTATLLIRGGVTSYANVGVATGKVLRGDMGCEVMRRFSMVGELVCDVNGLERAGRMLGCDVVCNRMCFSDAECEHQLRLLPCKVEVASGCEAQVVAELVVLEHDAVAVADEWMYMIGGKKDWEEYNIAVRGYLRGEQSDLDVAKAWSAAGGVGTPAHTVPSGTCRVVCSYLR